MIPQKLTFSPFSRRQIEADFSGDHITSDAGLLLLREVDKRNGLTQRVALILNDPRNPELVRHTLETVTRQRVFGLAAGYEDLNDHVALRFEEAFQPAISEYDILEGKSTLCRMEQRVNRQSVVKAHALLWHHFIELSREHNVSTALIYKWRSKFGGMDASMMKRLKELETENARLKKMPKSGSKLNCARKPLRESCKAISTPGDGHQGRNQTWLSIRLACVVYGISETCYRYQAKLGGENALVADWLLRLTQTLGLWPLFSVSAQREGLPLEP